MAEHVCFGHAMKSSHGHSFSQGFLAQATISVSVFVVCFAFGHKK